MTETRKIIKVFLGSPGDLGEERKLAKVAVDHLNEISANYIGYHIELVGWEDTVTRYGRPQESINQDLAQCVLFVGMLWKHWGSRPSADGKYTSGFEEEYSISVDEFKARGRPEICLLFKDVSDDLLNDPGESLKKVLAFKTNIQENKSILYETFADSLEFRKKFERCISYYLHKIREKEEKNSKSENQSLLVGETPEAAGVDSRVDGGGNRGLIDQSGIEFARRFVSSIETASQSDTPDPVDVARFRLIAALLGEQGNDEVALGPHDANLIFANKDSQDLSEQEKRALFRSGLNHLSSENTPFWYWVDFDQDRSNRALSVNSLFGPTDKRVGAINAMKLVAEPRDYDDVLNREFYHAKWLGASTETPIKIAALLYLSEFGDLNDIAAIKRRALAR